MKERQLNCDEASPLFVLTIKFKSISAPAFIRAMKRGVSLFTMARYALDRPSWRGRGKVVGKGKREGVSRGRGKAGGEGRGSRCNAGRAHRTA